jgi:hypothetical protein
VEQRPLHSIARGRPDGQHGRTRELRGHGTGACGSSSGRRGCTREILHCYLERSWEPWRTARKSSATPTVGERRSRDANTRGGPGRSGRSHNYGVALPRLQRGPSTAPAQCGYGFRGIDLPSLEHLSSMACADGA